MKKLVIACVVSCLSFNVFAKNKLNYEFKCQSTMPTTSFLLKTVDDHVVLTTVHHNGTSYMPIHEGIIVPNDFSYLKSVADVLVKMGEHNEFKFPLKKCEIHGYGLISCRGGESKVINGKEFEALSFYTSKITEEALGNVFQKNKVVLSVYIDGFVPVQTITNDFYGDECQFNF